MAGHLASMIGWPLSVRTRAALAQAGIGAQRRHEAQDGGLAQVDDLDGERERAAQDVDLFGSVRHDHHAARGRGDDLLPGQCPTAPLDEAELRVDLVGTVDGQVEFGQRFEIR